MKVIFILIVVLEFIMVTLVLLLIPLGAFFVVAFNLVKTLLRIIYDAFVFHVVLKTKGRVPAIDTFVSKRIKGPGLSSSFIYRIQPELVLLVIKYEIENIELEYFRQFVIKKIEDPIQVFNSVHTRLLSPFASRLDTSHPTYQYVSQRTNQLRDSLTELIYQRQLSSKVKGSVTYKNSIKLTDEDLDFAIYEGTNLVKSFITERVYPYLENEYEIQRFWESKKLKIDNWQGLAQQMMANNFGHAILEKFGDSDSQFALEVEHLEAANYFEMIFDNPEEIQNMRMKVGSYRTNRGVVATTVTVNASQWYYDNEYFNVSSNYIKGWVPSIPEKKSRRANVKDEEVSFYGIQPDQNENSGAASDPEELPLPKKAKSEARRKRRKDPSNAGSGSSEISIEIEPNEGSRKRKKVSEDVQTDEKPETRKRKKVSEDVLLEEKPEKKKRASDSEVVVKKSKKREENKVSQTPEQPKKESRKRKKVPSDTGSSETHESL